jgi:hypothetical protein
MLILAFMAGKAEAMPPADVWREQQADAPDAERNRFIEEMDGRSRRLCEALKRSGLWEFMTPEEHTFAEASIQSVDEEQRLQFEGAIEAVACLAWALKLANSLPPDDREADTSVLKLVPASDLRWFIDSAVLRAPEEIDAARDVVELWHWRSRTRASQESGKSAAEDEQLHRLGIRSYDDIVRMTARMAKEKGLLRETINDDFSVCGKAYRDLCPDEWTDLGAIALQRHRALNWLCGYSPGGAWEATPTDT